MTVLTVDLGNTSAKIDVWENGSHLYHSSVEDLNEEIPEILQKKYSLTGAIFSSVRKMALWDYARMQSLIGVESVLFPTLPTQSYLASESYRGLLGTDRIAAVVGAAQLFPGEPLLVVDAGTAMTVDLADKTGRFAGGNISLGLTGRLKALHELTALLPEVDKRGEVTDFGSDTVSAIRNGAVEGMTGEIFLALKKAREKTGAEKVVITGGDAELLMPRLTALGIDCRHDPYLVGRGLNADFIGWHNRSRTSF